MPIFLDPGHVLLDRRYSSKGEVIRAIGEVMVASGEVTPRYVQGMLQKEEQFNTCLTDGVALPHGTNDVKNEVRRNALVFVQLPEGTDWGEGKKVYLALGFAGRGDDQHLHMLASIARVLQVPELVAQLLSARQPEQVIAILEGCGLAGETVSGEPGGGSE